MPDKTLVDLNPQVVKVAQRLHFIADFYEQKNIPMGWYELSQAQRNQYLKYALQLLKIWEQT